MAHPLLEREHAHPVALLQGVPAEEEGVKETGVGIAEWAQKTFGLATSGARVAARANEEMAELLRVTTSGQPSTAIVNECADVVIVLARLAWMNGADLFEAVDAKMAVNRVREWKLDATGHGYHVRSKP